MTREEAINFFKGYLDEEVYTEKCRNAHDMAIKALEQEPQTDEIILSKKEYRELLSDEFEHGYDKGLSDAITSLEQEPCNDAISRQAVLDGLASIAKSKAKSDAQKSLMGRVMFFTERLPSVSPQQRTGRWVKEGQGGRYKWMCSNCGTHHRALYDYCPSCGCKMEVEDAD